MTARISSISAISSKTSCFVASFVNCQTMPYMETTISSVCMDVCVYIALCIPDWLQEFHPSSAALRELESALVSFSTWTSSCLAGQVKMMTRERRKISGAPRIEVSGVATPPP